MAEDQFFCEVLEDGTIRSETNKISPANHSQGEAFFRLLAELTGGKREVKRKTGQAHVHQHEETQQ